MFCRGGGWRRSGGVGRRVAVLAAVGAAAAGCAAGGGEGAETSSAVDGGEVMSSAPSVIDAPSGSSVPGSSVPGAPVVPPVVSDPVQPSVDVTVSTDTSGGPGATSATPLVGPPRAEFPDDPDRQAVVDAAYAFFDAARAAQADPADEELRARLAVTMTEPIAARMTAFLDGLVLDGVRIIANPDSPTYLEVFEPTVQVVGASGTFDACAVDSDIRVDNETGAVLNDVVASGVVTYKLTSVDGGWNVREFEIVRRLEGTVQCDFAP